jgi:hypothetical protein
MDQSQSWHLSQEVPGLLGEPFKVAGRLSFRVHDEFAYFEFFIVCCGFCDDFSLFICKLPGHSL